jgi:hypothetical protein
VSPADKAAGLESAQILPNRDFRGAKSVAELFDLDTALVLEQFQNLIATLFSQHAS